MGAELGICAERVRQLQQEGLAWLRHPAHSVRLRQLLGQNTAAHYRQALAQNAALRVLFLPTRVARFISSGNCKLEYVNNSTLIGPATCRHVRLTIAASASEGGKSLLATPKSAGRTRREVKPGETSIAPPRPAVALVATASPFASWSAPPDVRLT